MELRKFIATTIREYLNENYIISEATADEIKSKYYSNIPKNIFDKILKTDTTTSNLEKGKVGKYAKWLYRLYDLGNLELSDLEKAEKYIKIYDKLLKTKKDIINIDIINYKSLEELYKDIKDYVNNENEISKTDKVKKIKKESKIIYSDNIFIVIEPLSKEASCYYGKGTELCTSSTYSDNKFDSYIERGSLYFIFDKSKRNVKGDYFKYLIHFEDGEYKDENNRTINFSKNPEIKEIIKKIIIKLNIDPDYLIKFNPINIQFIDNPNEELQLKALTLNPKIESVIQYIKNPTEKVQLTAININPNNIQYIKNPTEKVQLTAININPSVKNLINMSDKEKHNLDLIHYKDLLNQGYITKQEFNDFINL